jgi:tetratricopeptide (TPR) repeat protein
VFDWKAVVRERLGPLALDPERQEEVVEELAQQLDSAYRDELAKSADKFVAVRRSMAQFSDWEKLRNEVFNSVKGSRMPVWEQRGMFAPRRWLVWVSLAFSISFLLLPSFRKALHMLSFLRDPDVWNEQAFSDAALQKVERSGDQQKYARSLAYVALYSPDRDRAAAAARKAIALNPQLTWISAHVSRACCGTTTTDAREWIDQLKLWDPDNAYTHLLDAETSVHAEWITKWAKISQPNGELRRALAADPHHRAEMDRAFSAGRMDSYVARQFALDCAVLLDRGWDYPDTLLLASQSVDLPDLGMLKMHADYLVFDLGPLEESAGRPEKALAIYNKVAQFGQKMADADTTLEQMISSQLRKEALQKKFALLRREHRDAEASDAEMALATTLNEEKKGRLEFTSEPVAYRSGQIILVSGVFALLLSILAAVWLISVVILRRWHNLSGRVNGIASRLGWSPAALSVSCLALFLSFLPYAKSIQDYSAPRELVATFNGIYLGFQSLRPNYILDVWIDHMFWPVIWCLAIVVVGIVVLAWTSWRRPPTRLAE